jgi:hypothetical protein
MFGCPLLPLGLAQLMQEDLLRLSALAASKPIGTLKIAVRALQQAPLKWMLSSRRYSRPELFCSHRNACSIP